MTDGLTTVTGMVLSAMPVGDYDKRIVVLTKEFGKIHGFARGARKPGNQMMAAANPFVFGEFDVMPGRDAYSFRKASIKNYFQNLTRDFDKMCYGSYFLEMADYYALENADESDRLILLYQTMRALESDKFSLSLIRSIYEIKTMAINGEYPNMFSCVNCQGKENLDFFSLRKRGLVCKNCYEKIGGEPIDTSTAYAFQYILSTRPASIYNFKLSEQVEGELADLIRRYNNAFRDHHFKSQEFIDP